jgi:rRNA maturation RNase YbeY
VKISLHRNGFSSPLPSSILISRILNRILRFEDKDNLSFIRVIFVDKKDIKRLHQKFLNDKSETDVMAFPVIEMNREKKYLGGEIYVCVPVAIANAKRWQEPPRRELMRLVVHGFLHLLG